MALSQVAAGDLRQDANEGLPVVLEGLEGLQTLMEGEKMLRYTAGEVGRSLWKEMLGGWSARWADG